jgi:hypothetical protein
VLANIEHYLWNFSPYGSEHVILDELDIGDDTENMFQYALSLDMVRLTSSLCPHVLTQEMVQLDGSEYMFGEHGGRGTTAPTFFKRLTSYGSKTHKHDDVKVVGASYSHADNMKKNKKKSSKDKEEDPSRRSGSYTDLDDDWDANVDNGLRNTQAVKCVENKVEGSERPDLIKPSSKDVYPSIRQISASNIKSQVFGILHDPSNSLNAVRGESDLSVNSTLSKSAPTDSIKLGKFKTVLAAPNVDIGELKKLAWSGIPLELRPLSWQLLLGYLPTNSDRRVDTLARKRQEYKDGVEHVFHKVALDQAMWHQIEIDVPRTNPHLKLYGFPATQRSLERILYLWAVRHPASGYVQGINDLVTPFFQTFLSAYIDEDVESCDPAQLPREVMDVVEADSFWCLSKLLEGIQDNYVHAQPGIQRQVAGLRDLTSRIDAKLAKHLESEQVEFMQFSFRWMNCLLMRELSVKNTIRMWDTYMAEGPNGFSEFHVYVCATFLVRWSAKLIHMEFQDIMIFLQSLPTKDWGEGEIELLLSEAFMWQSLFKNASAHLR